MQNNEKNKENNQNNNQNTLNSVRSIDLFRTWAPILGVKLA